MQKLKNEARPKFTGSYKKKKKSVYCVLICAVKVNEPDNNPYQEGWP